MFLFGQVVRDLLALNNEHTVQIDSHDTLWGETGRFSNQSFALHKPPILPYRFSIAAISTRCSESRPVSWSLVPAHFMAFADLWSFGLLHSLVNLTFPLNTDFPACHHIKASLLKLHHHMLQTLADLEFPTKAVIGILTTRCPQILHTGPFKVYNTEQV